MLFAAFGLRPGVDVVEQFHLSLKTSGSAKLPNPSLRDALPLRELKVVVPVELLFDLGVSDGANEAFRLRDVKR